MGINKWHKKPLKSLCTRIGDGLHGTPTYDENSEFYFINGNNLKNGKIEITNNTNTVTKEDFKKNFIPLDENTLLLSINGTLGSMAFYNNEKIMLGKSAAYINFKENVNKFYYYYFQLKEIQEYFYNVATGSTIKNLSLKSIQDFEVPIPDKVELENISNVLSSLDSKIELNNKINKELEAMAKTLYDYWFVQFDFPDENGKPYKSSGGKMVYNRELKREIPDGWDVKELKELIKIERGISYKSTDINDGIGCPMINLNSFYLDGSYKPEGIKYFNNKYSSNKVIKSGDLIIATTDVTRNADIIGKATIVPNIYENDILLSCDIAKLVHDDSLDKYFLEKLFNSNFYHEYIKGFASGTLVLHLNTDGIGWYKTFVPPKNLLDEFSKLMASIQKKKELVTIENQELAKLKDWLLPMLMNWQVKVK
ncbi:restriction endonuclease subunit S [Aliarcobacter butzleri]|uniref:restriction endonuclease subunit S n=1 Tax=Aliarcobacter butzleri TaxID=28197 RepID=UPI002874AF13|nr:restriction endonuclease subunit S [Aliarcobacter butzleri]MDS1314375.1 restriction endonuclease subunit S [Aliarcobacter butzleri]